MTDPSNNQPRPAAVESGVLPPLPAPAGDIYVNWGTPQQSLADGFSAAQMDAHAREAWTAGLDYGMAHAPAAVETRLPDLARLLGTASKEGKAVKLSPIAAGAIYNAMTSGAGPASSTAPLQAPGHEAHTFTSENLALLKALAQDKAADGANWSMDVGCMFVLAMIERIEADAGKARIAELEGAIDKLAACKGRFHTEANFKALIDVRGKNAQ